MWNQLDALTGLLNQNIYLNRTAEMRRSGGVLVVFDVDDFKQINDRYGHLQGDVCLAEIADCIKKPMHFANGLPWLCRLFRGGRGRSEGPCRPRALLC